MPRGYQGSLTNIGRGGTDFSAYSNPMGSGTGSAALESGDTPASDDIPGIGPELRAALTAQFGWPPPQAWLDAFMPGTTGGTTTTGGATNPRNLPVGTLPDGTAVPGSPADTSGTGGNPPVVIPTSASTIGFYPAPGQRPYLSPGVRAMNYGPPPTTT